MLKLFSRLPLPLPGLILLNGGFYGIPQNFIPNHFLWCFYVYVVSIFQRIQKLVRVGIVSGDGFITASMSGTLILWRNLPFAFPRLWVGMAFPSNSLLGFRLFFSLS